jgi:hypothetical protein
VTRTVDDLLGSDWRDEVEVEPDPYGFEPLTEAEKELLDQLLSPAQVARALGLSRQRVDQLMGAPLPYVRIGELPQRFVLRRDVARYAEIEGLPRPASSRRWKRVSQPPLGGA